MGEGLISPKDVFDDPKKWLSVLHEMHESLSSFMDKIFATELGKESWNDRLIENKVHCLLCEGKPVDCFDINLNPVRITGYIGDREAPEYFYTVKR